MKRKFCELAVSDVSCPFKKIKQEEELVDHEINSPEVEREESSRLGMIQIDEIETDGSIPLENFNHDKLADNILTKKITVRENFLPKQKYFQPTPSRWLLTPEEAARAIVPYVDAQQIILNNNSEYKHDDLIELDNVPTNDLLFDSYNYTHIPYQQHNLFHIDDYHNTDEIGDVEEVEDDSDMGMEII